MKGYYINFRLENIEYDEYYYMGTFCAVDHNVSCEFIYNRRDNTIEIMNENRPADDILPIPIWWLDKKLAENGKLERNESRICY